VSSKLLPVQALTQLAQQVSQIAQMVGAILSQGAGRLFRGLGGTLPGGWGIPQLPTSAWLTQLAQWVTAILGQAQAAVWSEWGSEWGQAPDYSYSTTQIATELERIAVALPADIAQWVGALAARLAQAPAPVPGTPQASSTAAATINSVFAGPEHAVQEAQVAATATQAAAQAAAEQAQQAAALATAGRDPAGDGAGVAADGPDHRDGDARQHGRRRQRACGPAELHRPGRRSRRTRPIPLNPPFRPVIQSILGQVVNPDAAALVM